VQPLHDDDDRAMPLVVEPAVEGVVVPVVAGLPLRLGERFRWLLRIVDHEDVGTASVSTPPGRVRHRDVRMRPRGSPAPASLRTRRYRSDRDGFDTH
jgi:hypothetical protein